MPDATKLCGSTIEAVDARNPIPSGTRFTIGGTELEPGRRFPRVEWIEFDSGATAVASHDKVRGELEDGRFVAVDVMHTDAASGARCLVGASKVFDYRPPGWGRAVWMFTLANFTMGGMQLDERHGVHVAKPDGSTSWHRVVTSFCYHDREWFLGDRTDGEGVTLRPEFRKHWKPLVSARLWTELRDSDDAGEVDLLACDIAHLLSFASGRCVRWLGRSEIGPTGTVISDSWPAVWCAPAKLGGNGPLEMGDPHQLEPFMERAGAVVREDREWWARTLQLHLQGMLSDILDVRLTFFYVLLDRISSKVLNTKFPPQIDPSLGARLSSQSWREGFHAVLRQLTSNWTTELTEQLLQRIEEWNAAPSFTKRVKDTAARCGLPEPHGDLVRGRNAVVHVGNLPSKRPPGLKDPLALARATEALVAAMLLRMLNFDGSAYLAGAGCHHLPIYPWPPGRPCPWATPELAGAGGTSEEARRQPQRGERATPSDKGAKR